MEERDYLEQRLDDQINWYDIKSLWNQKWYKRFQVTLIVMATLIPFLIGFIELEELWIKSLIGLLGVIIAFISGLLGVYKFHEHWIEYRTTCESLRHEKYLFLTGAAPYDGDNPFHLLVQRVESQISKENTGWAQYKRPSNS